MLSRTVIDANVAATWNVRPMPRCAIRCVASPRSGWPSKPDVAAVRRQFAVNDVEARRLARAVAADHRHHFARGDGERDVAHRIDAVERLGERTDAEQRSTHRVRRNRKVPPMPFGKTLTISRMPTPTHARQYSV